MLQTSESLVFIDSRISNLELVVASLGAGTRWALIDAEQDGLTQIAAALQGMGVLQSIQVISHGGSGSLLLGSGSITSNTLLSQAALLAGIGAALAPEGDLLLYGCNVAQGDAGAEFIALLAQLTGVDVAASTDLTGDASLGGDWELEANTGAIEATSVTATAVGGVLTINQVPTGSVLVTGVPEQGQALTASNTLADPDGIPASGSGAIAYQWKADGVDIAGATSSTYTITQAEVGKSIAVSATYLDNGGTQEIVSGLLRGSLDTSYVLNGKGGADTLIGGEYRDYLWIAGYLSQPGSGSGAGASPSGTSAFGGGGDDAFRLYTNQSSPWIAPTVSINGGAGYDTVAVNGEWGLDWDLRPITLTSIEQLALAWFPNSAELTIRMSSGQLASIQAIGIEAANLPGRLRIFSDGTELSATAVAALTQGSSVWSWDYPSGTASIIGSDSTNDILAVPAATVSNVNDAPTGSVTIVPNSPLLLSLDFEGANGSTTFGPGVAVRGGAVISTDHKVSGSSSVYFNGAGAALQLDKPELIIPGTDFSIEFHFKTDGWQNPWSVLLSSLRQGIWGEISNGTANGESLRFYNQNAGVLGANFNDGQWHHVVARQSGAVSYLYVDGNLQGQIATTATAHDFSDLLIGKLGGIWLGLNDNSFKGWIDDLQVRGAEQNSSQGPSLSAANTLDDLDGLGPITYQWQADGLDIAGATGNSYVLGLDQVGKAISVVATYTDAYGTAEAVPSAATTFVAAMNSAPTFSAMGDGQLLLNNSGISSSQRGLVVQPDGRFVVAGTTYNDSSDFALARYSADGVLDTSFSNDGKLSTDLAALPGLTFADFAHAVALQSDGKILVAGDGNTGFALVRYNIDGTLDTSFSSDGKVVGGPGISRAIALQTDGKILLAGFNFFPASFALERYNADGSRDTSFGTTGRITTDFGGTASGYSVTLQADGKIVVAGSSNGDFALARYNSDGSLDPTFSGDGKLTTDFGSDDCGLEMVLQSDGKIVVTGFSGNDIAVARYNTDGSLDTSFSDDGKQTTDVGSSSGDEATALALQPDGKIVVAGSSNGDFALVRYNPNGSLDTSFSGDGKLTTNTWPDDYSIGVWVEPDGKIILAGNPMIGSDAAMLTRYNPDGSLDPWFDSINTLNGASYFRAGGAPVLLDSDVQVFDKDLSASNGGAGNYAGASLILQRQGSASEEDLFSGAGDLGPLIEGAIFTLLGLPVGTVIQNSAGRLELSFNDNATQARLNDALRGIAYSNSGTGLPASVTIDWTFIDGNSWAQGSGGPLSVNGSTVVNLLAANTVPTGSVLISGVPNVGNTLSATNTLTDPDGMGPVTYQWKADGVEITGATSSTFVLTYAQVGKAISVAAAYTDGAGTLETSISLPTAIVFSEITGTPGADFLTGGAQSDSIYGLDGNDALYGDAGDDLLIGGLGNDTFTGEGGSDTIIGSAMTAVPWPISILDFDVLRHGYFSTQIDLSARTVSVVGESGIDSYSGIEEIYGGINASDIVTGRTSDTVSDYSAEGSRILLRLFGGSDSVSVTGYGYQQPFADGAMVYYDWSATGIQLSYSGNEGTVQYGAAGGQVSGTDSLVNVGLISGTSYDDILDTSNLITNQWGYVTNPALGKSWVLLYVGHGGSDTIIGNDFTFVAFDQVSSSSNGLGLSFDLNAGTSNVSHLSGYSGWNGTRALGTMTFSGVNGVSGTRFADTLVGGMNDDYEWFRGNGGNDLINGGAGFDRADYTWAGAGMTFNLLSGVFSSSSDGQDTVRGVEEIRTTRFDDVFNAGGFVGGFESTVTNISSFAWGLNAFVESGGYDTIIGNGNTRIDYTNSLVPIEVDLASGFVDARIATDKGTDLYKTLGRDTVSGVYAVRGSAFDDLLQGGGTGGGELASAYESFRGGAGHDTIDGRTGTDLAEYENSPHSIAVNLSLSSGQVIDDGWGFSDTLISVENISGSYGHDSIVGDAASNELQGGFGHDTLIGGFGNDTLAGGSGDDLLNGEIGSDLAVFAGTRSNYLISNNPDGSVQVADLRNGIVSGFDGTDTLSGIETLRFSDADVAVTSNAGSSLSGVVYHWKSHMLLSGVEVFRVSAEPNRTDLPPAVLDLRNYVLSDDLATGNDIFMVEVWANTQAGDADFQFSVNTTGAIAANFTSSVGASWSVLANTTDPNALLIGGFDSAAGAAGGPVLLGTLALTYGPAVSRVDTLFSAITVGSVTGPDLRLADAMSTTGVNGQWSSTAMPAGDYNVDAWRANTDTGNAITSADALAALRLAVNINPNPDPDGAGPLSALRVSPYQFIAADVNGSNTVTSADALAILRMAVKLPTALPNEWFFVEESRDFWNEATNSFTLTRTNAGWDRNIAVDLAGDRTLNLVGGLKGDVNGSWTAPAGSIDLDTGNPNYFTNLATSLGMVIGSTPVTDQWGV